MANLTQAIVKAYKHWNFNAELLPGARGSQAFGANGRVYLAPVLIPNAIDNPSIAILVSTLSAGSNLRLGLYREAAGSTKWVPDGGRLVGETGAISTASTGVKNSSLGLGAVADELKIPAGRYFVALHGANTTLALQRYSTANTELIHGLGGDYLKGAYFDQAFGALPATCPTTTYDTTGEAGALMFYIQEAFS